MKRIVMFGGGSGSRDITMALCRQRYEVTRVVPAWDSGGSSRALRAALGILAMGDIRQALMTMAHGEGRVSSVVRFFNARLSETSSQPDLLAEFDFYVSGAHPLLATMEPGQSPQERRRFVSLSMSLAKILGTAGSLVAGLTVGREGPSVQVAAGVMHHARRWLPDRTAINEHGLMVAGGAAGIATCR